MIYITQGHERGVGLEIFIKAFVCMPKNQISSLKLITNITELENTLRTLNINYVVQNNQLEINNKALDIIPIQAGSYLSTRCLEKGIEICKGSDLLITLPTSKDQIVDIKNNINFNGHTDYLRSKFDNKSITMNFISPRLNVLLLSDHIELSQIYDSLNYSDILDKLDSTLLNLSKFRDIKRIHLAGVNPHCGEDGLISQFDNSLSALASDLKLKFDQLEIYDFVAADTIMFNDFTNEDLIVFSYHDQGLIPFKQENGFIGINLTLGLPFIRMSVDHGTAFSLYGKNKANYQGMLYLLNEVIKNPAFAGL